MFCNFAAIGVILATAIAQTTSSQQQQPPTFRTGAELVRVDVTVLDRSGRPVKNLTAADFSVEEDGVLQKIQTFRLIELTGEPVPGDDTSLRIGSASHAASELGRDDVRVFLVFWDEYRIPQMWAPRLRDELQKFLRTMVRPTDLIALMDEWTPMSHLQFTRDQDLLLAAAVGLKGRQGVFTPPRNVAEENHLAEGRGRINFLRAQVSLSALKSAVMHLGSLRQGRSSVIYIGRDFVLGRGSHEETIDLIRAANDANVAFYLVTPDGIEDSRFGTGILSDLAHNTGGEAPRTNAPEVGFQRAVQQASATYLLGYAPEPMRHDGRFHKIKVQLKPSGMQVRARNGYWAPTAGARREAREVAAAATPAPEIGAAFGQLARLDRPDDEGTATIRTVTTPDPPSDVLTVRAPDLWCVSRPADLRAVLSDTPPAVHSGREFARMDRLILRFAVEGTSSTEAKVSAALIDRRGKRLTALPLEREARGWKVDLPLNSVARGDYVIAIEAAAGDHGAAAYLPFRVK